MCAMTAGRRGFSCAVIDHSPVAGRKVRLAGGGKGNVTNRYISPEWYVGTQKGFPDTLLKRCSTDFVLSMLGVIRHRMGRARVRSDFLHGAGGPARGVDGSRLPQCGGGIAAQPYVRRNPARGRPVLCGNVRRHPTGPAPCHRNREPRMARLRGNGWGNALGPSMGP